MKYPDGFIDDIDGCCGDVMCEGLDPIDGKDAERLGYSECPNFSDCNTYVECDGDWCEACSENDQ